MRQNKILMTGAGLIVILILSITYWFYRSTNLQGQEEIIQNQTEKFSDFSRVDIEFLDTAEELKGTIYGPVPIDLDKIDLGHTDPFAK